MNNDGGVVLVKDNIFEALCKITLALVALSIRIGTRIKSRRTQVSDTRTGLPALHSARTASATVTKM